MNLELTNQLSQKIIIRWIVLEHIKEEHTKYIAQAKERFLYYTHEELLDYVRVLDKELIDFLTID